MPLAVILTALPVEYLAVRAHLQDIQEETHPQGTIYERGRFEANGQVWNVGIAEVGRGNAVTATETERAISYFKPDVLFFVGIAGGIKDVNIGDVVAATKVYGYEAGRQGEQFFTRPEIGQSAYRLRKRAESEARKENWINRILNDSSWETETQKLTAQVAPIAAGERVVASQESELFQFLRRSYNDAIAVEMEGFGFLSAAFAYPAIQAIVIRGISDLIDNKDDKYQEIAAHHASAFAFEMLANYRIEEQPPVKPIESSFADLIRSIERYERENIRAKLNEKIYPGEFSEEITYEDNTNSEAIITNEKIYVPLFVKPVGSKNEENITDWVTRLLQDPKGARMPIFIEGDSGLGKSIFCRMFSNHILDTNQKLDPALRWYPVLIQLDSDGVFTKGIDDINIENFLETEAIFLKECPNWKQEKNIHLLFIIDGCDELLLRQSGTAILGKFLIEIEKFQKEKRNHQFILTGRSLQFGRLKDIVGERYLSAVIQRMNEEKRKEWWGKFIKIFPQEGERLRNFSVAIEEAQKFQDLIEEPLLLYLTANLFMQSGEDVDNFIQKVNTSANTKVEIFREAVDWILSPEQHIHERIEHDEWLEVHRELIYEAALCVIQAGGNVEEKVLATRLKTVSQLEEVYSNFDSDHNQLKGLLARIDLTIERREEQETFYKFVHGFLSEFLVAERLKKGLITCLRERGLSKLNIHKKIYDLLGYGGIKPQIVDYLVELLQIKLQVSDWNNLIGHLNEFYACWLEGEYIDICIEEQNSEKDILREITAQKQRQQNLLVSMRTVDVYAGLNVMALLFRFYQHLKDKPEIYKLLDHQNFSPVGDPNSPSLRTRLLQIISYSQSIQLPTFPEEPRSDESRVDSLIEYISFSSSPFEDVLQLFLSGSNLQALNLAGMNFRGMNLRRANLSKTVFIQSNLSYSELNGANLESAKLRRANLCEADLSEANLKEANLDSADLNSAKLIGACLRGASLARAHLLHADLNEACLPRTDLRGAIFDRTTLCKANLRGAILTHASFRRANLRGADLTQAELYSANFVNAVLAEADLTGVRWDDNISWFGARGLHKLRNVPDDLEEHPQFRQAKKLSEAIENFCHDPSSFFYKQLFQVHTEILGEDQLGQALNEEVSRSISKRLKAALWNKFCWLCTLFGYANEEKVIQATERIKGLMEDFKQSDPDYLDTLGLNLLVQELEEGLSKEAAENKRKEAAERFQGVLDSEYRSSWTYELMKRREDWLDYLKNRDQNPFRENSDWLEELKREESSHI